MKKIFSFLTLLFLTTCTFAQVTINAQVDKTAIDVNDNIYLTVTVSAPSTNISVTEMPSLPNFNIYSSGESRNVSMGNGKVNITMKFNYILSPRFSGKSTVGAFVINVDGKTYTTAPIEVEVSRSAPSAPRTSAEATQNEVATRQKQQEASKKSSEGSSVLAPNFFMTAIAKDKAYLNEQINLKIRFYQSQNTLGRTSYDRPILKGLIAEELATRQGYETIGAKQFAYVEFDLALFGIVPGMAEVGSASVTYTTSDSADVFDFFFSGRSSTKKVESAPIKIDILSLPKEGRPASFYGAVGDNYKISMAVDNTSVQAGEPINLTITVQGDGNMRAISDIPVPDLGPSFRVYETSSSSDNSINGSLLSGTKKYKTVIVPRVSGTYDIAGIAFTYFDPNAKKYKTVTSKGITLKVTPSSSKTSQALSFGDEEGKTSEQIERITKDINYIKTDTPHFLYKFLNKISSFGFLNYLVFVLILGTLFVRLLTKGEISFATSRRPLHRVRKDISRASNLDDISDALRVYLGAKLSKPIGLMSISDICNMLKLTPDTAQSLTELWQHFDMLKYAPSAQEGNSSIAQEKERALNLVLLIDKECK